MGGVHTAKLRLLGMYLRSAGPLQIYGILLSEETHLMLDRVLSEGAEAGSEEPAHTQA